MRALLASRVSLVAIVVLFAAFFGVRGCVIESSRKKADGLTARARSARIMGVRQSLESYLRNKERTYGELIDAARAGERDFGDYQETVARGIAFTPPASAQLQAGATAEEQNAVIQGVKEGYEDIVGGDARFDAVWRRYRQNDKPLSTGSAEATAKTNQRLADLALLTAVAKAAQKAGLRRVTELALAPMSRRTPLSPALSDESGYLSADVLTVKARGSEDSMLRFLTLVQTPAPEGAGYLYIAEADIKKDTDDFLKDDGDTTVSGAFTLAAIHVDTEKKAAGDEKTTAGSRGASRAGGRRRRGQRYWRR